MQPAPERIREQLAYIERELQKTHSRRRRAHLNYLRRRLEAALERAGRPSRARDGRARQCGDE